MQSLDPGETRKRQRFPVILIRGKKVALRVPVSNDRDEWINLRRANWSYLRYAEPTPARGSDPCGVAAFDRVLASAVTERTRRFLICATSTGEIMGQISFGGIARGCFQSCFVGYWIGREFAGQGLMTESLYLAVRYAFAQIDLHRIEANITPSNHASRAVAYSCGFRYEGRARRLLHLAGRWRDHERWAIIRAI
jgi:[ribosomal protein S5]-alanine N-acetyltransferase